MKTVNFGHLTSCTRVECCGGVVHAVAGVVLLCGVGGVHRRVTPRAVQLQLPVLALLADGVHLGQEDGGEEKTRNCHNSNSYRRVVEGGRGEVVDQGPGDKN